MARYSDTERVGVNTVESIIIKEIGWIFREQPIVDVGIDAFIEQTINDEPTGKFIAVQIKSGLGNVKEKQKEFTYYASNVHKQYWLGCSFPVIMVLHDPKTDRTYWEELSDETFKKTRTKWKISISKNKELNYKSERLLSKIVLNQLKEVNKFVTSFLGDSEQNSLEDHYENTESINKSTESLYQIVDVFKKLTLEAKKANAKFINYGELGYDDSHSKVKASIKNYAQILNYYAQKLNNEIEFFSTWFADGMNSYEEIAIHQTNSDTKIKDISTLKKAFVNVPKSIVDAGLTIKSVTKSFQGYPEKYPSLKQAKKKCLETFKTLEHEFEDANALCQRFLRVLDSILKD